MNEINNLTPYFILVDFIHHSLTALNTNEQVQPVPLVKTFSGYRNENHYYTLPF